MAFDMHFNRRDVSPSWSPDSYPVSHADASGQQNYGVNIGGNLCSHCRTTGRHFDVMSCKIQL